MRTWLRADLLIAVCALLISSLTCVATFFQTRVIANQLSASVWPYLSFTTTYSPSSLAVTLDNDGLGPALIRSAELTIDGHAIATWEDAAKALGTNGKIKTFNQSYSSIGPGSVIRAGTSRQLFLVHFTQGPHLDGQATYAALHGLVQDRSTITVCYCSTLENCWVRKTGERELPLAVPRCTDASEIGS